QLSAHLDHMLGANAAAAASRASFKTARDNWCATTGYDRESAEAMNWISSQTATFIRSAPTPAAAAGVVTFFCHQFRNSLLHMNEENLTIFTNQSDCLAAAGWVLAMLRVCARAKDGTFSPAQFP